MFIIPGWLTVSLSAKSTTYLATLPSAKAFLISALFTRPPLAKLRIITPSFICAIVSALIVFLVESISGT